MFGPFGEFVGFLGGTLMQLIVPAVFAGYFLRRRDRFAATVALWDRAEPAVHLLGVALYALAIIWGARTAGEESAES